MVKKTKKGNSFFKNKLLRNYIKENKAYFLDHEDFNMVILMTFPPNILM